MMLAKNILLPALCLGLIGFLLPATTQAQTCSIGIPDPEPLRYIELTVGPDEISATYPLDVPCVIADAANKLDDVILVAIKNPAKIPIEASWIEVEESNKKFDENGQEVNCATGYEYSTVYIPMWQILGIFVKKATVGAADEYACFDIEIEHIGELDPRVRVVKSVGMMGDEPFDVPNARIDALIDRLLMSENETYDLLDKLYGVDRGTADRRIDKRRMDSE